MLEREIEKKVCKYAEEKGFLQYKFSSPAHAGVPDRLFIGVMGQVFMIEFKREGGKPTELQTREARKLNLRGVATYLVDSVDSGIAVIDNEYEGMLARKQFQAAMAAGEVRDASVH